MAARRKSAGSKAQDAFDRIADQENTARVNRRRAGKSSRAADKAGVAKITKARDKMRSTRKGKK